MIVLKEANNHDSQLYQVVKNLEEIVKIIKKVNLSNSAISDKAKLLALKNIQSLLEIQAQLMKKIIITME
jgi:hypothetical protein